MSRICGFSETSAGHGCMNLVSDGGDHCSAGHSCMPVITGATQRPEMARADIQSFEVDDVCGPNESARNIFGKQLAHFFTSDQVYALIDSHPETYGGTPTAGACWAVAEMILRLVPESEIYALVSSGELPQHFAVRSGDTYYDADGASTAKQLLSRWTRLASLNGAHLEPATPAMFRVCSYNPVCPSTGEHLSDELLALFCP